MNANPIEITKDAVGGALRVGRWAAGEAVGTLNRVRGRGATGGRPKDLDDVTIARKVETVVFRPAGREKGKIDVNVVDGVVWLRGEAKTPEKIKELEAKTREIPEVKNVENLLHLPKTAPSAKKRRKASTAAASPRQRAPKRTTAERPASTPAAEPTPAELAKKGEGRQPAPLGSTGSTNGSDSGSGEN
jgi:hypothetical protein